MHVLIVIFSCSVSRFSVLKLLLATCHIIVTRNIAIYTSIFAVSELYTANLTLFHKYYYVYVLGRKLQGYYCSQLILQA